jgi:ribosomal protein S18 acetylase RimI-like enzyme
MPTTLGSHGVHYRDWRTCDAGDVVPLVQAEIDAWRETLAWDVAESWRVIEPARQAGQLPGVVAFDSSGRPVGWSAYLPHQGHLQVMAVVADDEPAADAVLDGLLASAEAQSCASTILCVRACTPGLEPALIRRGFVVDSYRYLSIGLADRSGFRHECERWRHHEAAMAGLCAAAYRDSPGVRAFAPGGTRAEWQHYIETLVHGTGCGWFLPELSVVVAADASVRPRDGGPVVLRAGLMLSDLGTGTAHITQVAVDPAARGRGLARQLVQTALDESSRFYEQVSLLVSASNAAAVRLYESMGFRDQSRFIVASRPTVRA